MKIIIFLFILTQTLIAQSLFQDSYWKGTWTGSGFLFTFEMKLQETSNKELEGAFYWELTFIPKPYPLPYTASDSGKKATEFVKGSYDPIKKMLYLKGYKKEDPETIIALAKYELKLSDDLNYFEGPTFNLEFPDLKDGFIRTEKIELFTFKNVNFKANSADLLTESYSELDKMAEWLKKYPNKKICVNGHTDIGSTPQFNYSLSLKRAQSISNYLINKGINKSRITEKGFGNTKPVATNETPEGKKLNRRVEIEIVK